MIKYFLVFLFIPLSVSTAQYEIGGGMGLSFFNAPDLNDYLNTNFSNGEDLPSFSTSADFFGVFNYNLNESYQIGLEYNFNINSFNSAIETGFYDLQLSHHKTSLLGFYYLAGEGFKIKFGGGFGLRFLNATEELYGTRVEYSSSGFGFIAKMQGDTKLGGNFYALISGEIIYDLPGEINTLTEGHFNASLFGFGLKLGTIYYF